MQQNSFHKLNCYDYVWRVFCPVTISDSAGYLFMQFSTINEHNRWMAGKITQFRKRREIEKDERRLKRFSEAKINNRFATLNFKLARSRNHQTH
jgi:hypothetical protein